MVVYGRVWSCMVVYGGLQDVPVPHLRINQPGLGTDLTESDLVVIDDAVEKVFNKYLDSYSCNCRNENGSYILLLKKMA